MASPARGRSSRTDERRWRIVCKRIDRHSASLSLGPSFCSVAHPGLTFSLPLWSPAKTKRRSAGSTTRWVSLREEHERSVRLSVGLNGEAWASPSVLIWSGSLAMLPASGASFLGRRFSCPTTPTLRQPAPVRSSRSGGRMTTNQFNEPDALALWAGDGAVRLLRVDGSRRAMLLERASPGSDLAALGDAAAMTIAVGVAGRLWRPAAAPFQWIGDHVARCLAQAAPVSPAGRRLLERACEVFDRLDVRSGTLVHGDLHHHNILDGGTRYVAIDPKPMIGEPEFDVPPLLWNPLGSQMTQEETERRLASFADAGLDEARMRAWALIRGAYLEVGDWIGEPLSTSWSRSSSNNGYPCARFSRASTALTAADLVAGTGRISAARVCA